MPDKIFRAYYYRIDEEHVALQHPVMSFANAIRVAMESAIADREKDISGKTRRLETWDDRGQRLLLDFITFQFAGPGRVRSQAPVRTIRMAANESFAPETAIIYDNETRTALIESAREGLWANQLTGYFQYFAPGNRFTARPLLDAGAGARARRFGLFRKLELEAALGAPTQFDRELGMGVMQTFGEEFEGSIIKVEISVDARRDSSLTARSVQRIVDLLGAGRGRGSLRKATVTGKIDIEGRSQMIDLLQHREQNDRVLPIDNATRKIPHNVRWAALTEMLNELQGQ